MTAIGAAAGHLFWGLPRLLGMANPRFFSKCDPVHALDRYDYPLLHEAAGSWLEAFARAAGDERVNAIFRQLHYKFILRGHHGKDRALDLKCAGAEALPATDSDVSIVRERFDDFGEFLVHPVMPRSHSGNHIPRFVQHQSRAAPAVAFTTVPVSIRAWSEARSTAAFAVSWTVAGTLRKVDCEICAIAWSFVMFSWPETNSIVS